MRFERFITFDHPVVRALTDDFRFQLKHKFASLRGIHSFAKRRNKLTRSRNPWRVWFATEGKIERARVKAKRWERKGGCVGEGEQREKERETNRERGRGTRGSTCSIADRTGGAIQQLGGPLMVLFFSGYTLFYALFMRLPPLGHVTRHTFHSRSLPPHLVKWFSLANTFCVAPEIELRPWKQVTLYETRLPPWGAPLLCNEGQGTLIRGCVAPWRSLKAHSSDHLRVYYKARVCLHIPLNYCEHSVVRFSGDY